MFDNKNFFWGIFSEIILFVFFVYVPGVNHAFYMWAPDSVPATCALWIIPFIVGFEEIRKYLIRIDRGGCIE